MLYMILKANAKPYIMGEANALGDVDSTNV